MTVALSEGVQTRITASQLDKAAREVVGVLRMHRAPKSLPHHEQAVPFERLSPGLRGLWMDEARDVIHATVRNLTGKMLYVDWKR